MAEKYIFYPVSWKDSSEVTFEDIQKSVAIHEFASMGGNSKGEVIESLKKDYLRFQPCLRRNKTMKRHK